LGSMRVGYSHFPTVDQYLSLIWLVYPSQNVNQSRFTGSVFTNKAVNFSGAQSKIHLMQSRNTNEAFGDALHAYQRFGRRLRYVKLRLYNAIGSNNIHLILIMVHQDFLIQTTGVWQE